MASWTTWVYADNSAAKARSLLDKSAQRLGLYDTLGNVWNGRPPLPPTARTMDEPAPNPAGPFWAKSGSWTTLHGSFRYRSGAGRSPHEATASRQVRVGRAVEVSYRLKIPICRRKVCHPPEKMVESFSRLVENETGW